MKVNNLMSVQVYIINSYDKIRTPANPDRANPKDSHPAQPQVQYVSPNTVE